MSEVSNADKVDFWSDTIKGYQPLRLPYPEFTVKRLQKPSFRFIYDIVTVLNMRYSAYDHVIPEDFTDSSNIDTKEKKLEYLRILINYVEKLLKVTLNVNPKKIISGNEPEKTNMFLQCLAKACDLAKEDGLKTKAKNIGNGNNSINNGALLGGDEAEKPLVGGSCSGIQQAALHDLGMLPRRKKSRLTERERQESYRQALATSRAFTLKLSALSIPLSASEPQDIKEFGKGIVQMWKELKNPNMELTTLSLTPEALEVAIQRQIEKVSQLNQLLKEQDIILDNLESLLV